MTPEPFRLAEVLEADRVYVRKLLVQAYEQGREKALSAVRALPAGRTRNQPCACGSGKKTKVCAPTHPPTQAELDMLRYEAEWEDARRAPGGTAASIRKLAALVTLVGGPVP